MTVNPFKEGILFRIPEENVVTKMVIRR